jgi:hypothetical protein
MEKYYNKYLKYKTKYFNLIQTGGLQVRYFTDNLYFTIGFEKNEDIIQLDNVIISYDKDKKPIIEINGDPNLFISFCRRNNIKYTNIDNKFKIDSKNFTILRNFTRILNVDTSDIKTKAIIYEDEQLLNQNLDSLSQEGIYIDKIDIEGTTKTDQDIEQIIESFIKQLNDILEKGYTSEIDIIPFIIINGLPKIKDYNRWINLLMDLQIFDIHKLPVDTRIYVLYKNLLTELNNDFVEAIYTSDKLTLEDKLIIFKNALKEINLTAELKYNIFSKIKKVIQQKEHVPNDRELANGYNIFTRENYNSIDQSTTSKPVFVSSKCVICDSDIREVKFDFIKQIFSKQLKSYNRQIVCKKCKEEYEALQKSIEQPTHSQSQPQSQPQSRSRSRSQPQQQSQPQQPQLQPQQPQLQPQQPQLQPQPQITEIKTEIQPPQDWINHTPNSRWGDDD